MESFIQGEEVYGSYIPLGWGRRWRGRSLLRGNIGRLQ